MSSNKQQKQQTSNDKFKNISVDKRAFLYLFFMGVIGATIGTVDSKIAIEECLNSESCTIENPAEMKISKLSMGACAGMFAATLLSIPALLKEEH